MIGRRIDSKSIGLEKDEGRDREVRELIRTMSQANSTWGTLRIIGELAKLGISVCKSTVDQYRIRRSGTPSPTWKSFLTNEASAIASIDFWTVQQIVEAFPWDSEPKRLLRGNDTIFDPEFSARVKGMNIKKTNTAY